MPSQKRLEKHGIPVAVAAATALFFCNCGQPELSGPDELPSDKQGPTIPARRVIADRSGRDITVDIVGRDERTITVVRIPDETRFTIPIDRLSTSDSEFVRQLPLTAPPPPTPPRVDTRTAPKRTEELIDPEVRILTRRIEDIDTEREKLEDELRTLDAGTIKFRSLQSKFDDLGRKKQEYERRIDQLQD